MIDKDDSPDTLPPAAALQLERVVSDLRTIYKRQRSPDSAPLPLPLPARKRILIVEDQSEVRRLIIASVKLEDHEVFEADNGDTGLAMALDLRPDLVILDIRMPGALDGLHVCRAIKSLPHPPKVLFLTGMGGRARVALAQKAGADDYLTKPFSPLELLDIVNDLLGVE